MTTHVYRTPRSWADLRPSLYLAAAIIAVSILARLVAHSGSAVAADWAWRITMAGVGGYLVITGNRLPKRIVPMSALQCDVAAADRCRRRVGWTWTLTGVAIVLSWLLLPMDATGIATMVVLPVAFVISATLIAMTRRTRGSNTPVSR